MTDPSELLKQLSANAEPRNIKSLTIIHEVCEEQHRFGSVDVSLAAGAISNTTSKAYRTLIKAHLNAAGGRNPRTNRTRRMRTPSTTQPTQFCGLGLESC